MAARALLAPARRSFARSILVLTTTADLLQDSMPHNTSRCRTDGFPLSHTHSTSIGHDGGTSDVVAERGCTNPWHPKRITCPRCGRSRKIVLASAVVQGEPVYLHCLRCRHLWKPARVVP